MGKVLYIEDELVRNIGAIQKYFAPVLSGRKLLQPLTELEKQSNPLPRDVVNICNKASEQDVVYKFPVALTKIVHRHRDYDLFIIDRDLSAYNYAADWDKIRAELDFTGLSEPEDNPDAYKGKEGDLLLLILLRLDRNNKDKIFLLSSAQTDIVRTSEQLETIIDLTHFDKARILTKGSQAEKVIGDIFTDLPAFTLQNRYYEQCDILRQRFSEEEVNEFIEIAKLEEDPEHKIDFLQKLRPLTEKLLIALAERLGDMQARYWKYFHGKPSLQHKDFINSLDEIDRRRRIGYNKNIRQCLYSLWQIPSDFANHTSGNQEDITGYTVTALYNQLCDVLLWFEKALRNLKN